MKNFILGFGLFFSIGQYAFAGVGEGAKITCYFSSTSTAGNPGPRLTGSFEIQKERFPGSTTGTLKPSLKINDVSLLATTARGKVKLMMLDNVNGVTAYIDHDLAGPVIPLTLRVKGYFYQGQCTH